MKNIDELSNAIIIQAVKDYRWAMNKLAKKSTHEKGLHMKEEVERFFKSEWFKTLTKVDPEVLLKKLQKEFPEVA